MPYKNRYTKICDSGRVQFEHRFGKTIETYESYRKAVESLRVTTVNSYLNLLPHYFLFLDQDPDTVIEQRKLDLRSDNIDDAERYERKTIAFLKGCVDKGLVGGAVSGYRGRIQGFFKNNNRRLALDLSKLKLSKARKKRKYSPSNDDVRVLFNKADSARDRLIVALMYQNGPAPVDVSELCCGDYPVEPWVCFERSRSKTGEVWRGVSTPDVCACLKAYLNVRGKYRPSDALFVGREGSLDATGISQIVSRLIDDCGFSKEVGFKPTSLRDAFEDALVDAEIYQKTKEALMAHTSSIQHHYGSQKKMEARLVEAMKKVYPLLCLNDSNMNMDVGKMLSQEQIEKLNKLLDWANSGHLEFKP